MADDGGRTVLGPPLSNMHFADAVRATQGQGFTEAVYADDLNCWRGLPATTGAEAAFATCTACQGALHKW